MSIWAQKLEDSQVLARLSELGPAIDEALRREDNRTDDVENLERLRTGLTLIGKRLDGADPDLLVTGNLEALSGSLVNATNHVRQFAADGDSDGNGDKLLHANTAMDSALSAFAGLLFPTSVADFAGLRTAITEYREAMSYELGLWGSTTANTRDKVTELVKKSEEFEQRLAEETERLKGVVEEVSTAAENARKETTDAFDSLVSDLQEKAKLELTSLRGEIGETSEAHENEHKEAMATRQSAFDAGLGETLSMLSATDDAWNKKLGEAHAAHDEQTANLRRQYSEKGQTMIATMEGQLARVQELVGAIGDHGVTAGFKRQADEARSEVVYWHRITFWSMIFLILVGVLTAFHFFEESLTWISLASRLYLSIATGVLAAYSASQAHRYQQRERRNRKLELELRALGPFLEPVDKAEREKFRLKIAEVFFGQDDGTSERRGPATPLELSKESVDKFLDLMKTAIEKLPGK